MSATTEEMVIRCDVQPNNFTVKVDRVEWESMTADEREVYCYECAEEFDKIRVTWEFPL